MSAIRTLDIPAVLEPAPAVVRLARRGDARGAWLVECVAFGEADRFTLRRIAGLIANPRARVFVAEAGAEVVGWAAVLLREDASGGRSGRLYTLAVSPTRAGRGLGRLLAEHAMSALEGARVVSLEVRAENRRAIGLYESMGFRVTRRLPGYYAGADGLRMVRRDGPGAVNP